MKTDLDAKKRCQFEIFLYIKEIYSEEIEKKMKSCTFYLHSTSSFVINIDKNMFFFYLD